MKLSLLLLESNGEIHENAVKFFYAAKTMQNVLKSAKAPQFAVDAIVHKGALERHAAVTKST